MEENIEYKELFDKIPELKGDLEAIAKEVHDSWMRQRKKEGWSYGKRRCESRKKTPRMVDYEELPESEKEVDRATALETVSALLKIGYTVRR